MSESSLRPRADDTVQIYVVNLDRSTERMASIAAGFGALRLPFRRLAAVDARQLEPEAIAAAYDADINRRRYFAPLSAGEVACFLSHRHAWSELLASAHPFAAVFEDDAVPAPGLPDVLAALRDRASGWDLVKLHGKSLTIATPHQRLVEGHELVRPWLVSLGSAAYCVSRSGARKLLAGTERFHRPLDVEFQHWWETGLDLLAVSPNVATEVRFAAGSTIRPHGRQPLAAQFEHEIRRPLYRGRLALRSIAERWRAMRRPDRRPPAAASDTAPVV